MANGRENFRLAWRWRKAAALAIAIIGTVAIGNFILPQVEAQLRGKLGLRLPGAPVEAADPARMAFPLPDKPSIAVLPFDNLSGDPDQDFLGDGLTENIISALSKASGMFVIARNSTFTYKGKRVKVQQVAEDLGVRYVLEGSVQHDGDRLRVNVQLIDAVKGHHLWAENYDRDLEDLFAVQDDITRQIVLEMQVQLTEGEQARIRQRATNDLQAWGYAAKAYDLFERFTPEDNFAALQLFQRAVELDPNYAWAMAMLGWTYHIDGEFGFSLAPAASLKMAEEIGRKAIALDDSLLDAISQSSHLASHLAFMADNYDEALEKGRRAITIDPNSAEMRAVLSNVTLAIGNWDETIALSKAAVRLHPQHPSWYLAFRSIAYTFKGEYDLAIATAKEGLRRAETDDIRARFHLIMVFALMEAGQEEEARRHMAERLRLRPNDSAARRRKLKFVRFRDPAHLERILAAYVKAGMPDGAHAQGFTAEQAASGKTTFEKNCQQCHAADLAGGGPFPPLTGERFMSRWGNQTAGDLFNFISSRMPYDRPGQLAKRDYVNIVAYWLSFHNHAPGSERLTDNADQLEGIVLQP